MLRRYVFLAIAALLFAVTGHSLISVPEREIVCELTSLPQICEKNSCLLPLLLKIGNTGRVAAQQITVRLPPQWREDLVMKPKLSRFGKISAKYYWDSDNRLSFGPLEATKWVELSLLLQQSAGERFEKLMCTELVELPGAKVLSGSPEFLRLGRFAYRVLTLFL